MGNHVKQVFIYLFLFFSIMVISDCFGQGKPKSMAKIKSSPPEDFAVFYERFHSDSLFQMARIRFPLDGLIVDGNDQIIWTPDNWELMQTRVYQVDTTQFKTKVKKKKKYFEQTLWMEGTNFSSKRRFEILGNRWFLVYAYEGNL